MNQCQNNDNLIVATYDLQAVLPCPVGDSSAFFYKTRLNCYNFTVGLNITFLFLMSIMNIQLFLGD